MTERFPRCMAILLLSTVLAASSMYARVRVSREPLTLPTYRIGQPERLPMWQHRFGRIYPYTLLDSLTDDRYERTYRAIWLENEYVRALILPEIGGRLHGAEDRTSGYQFMQDQRTIKPALVGMAGAWISGGVEWNFPDGHRITGFRPTDWRIVHNPDSSITVWTGEIEHVYGMRWSVGNTVHPGRNWIETKVRLYNCTSLPHAFLYWADSGVRGTPEFTAVIPGSEIATGHGKHRFFHWPVHEGRDLRKWKNAPGGTSYFSWNNQSDYFGTWSPEHRGGLVHVADHHIVRGKKLWFCGTSPAGRLWERVLTDGDAPLVEPQAGAYSDNQPDYLWLMPGETKTFSHFWFPVREIGMWHYANIEGALRLALEDGRAEIGWHATGDNRDARVVLSLAGGPVLLERTIDAGPATPFTALAETPPGTEIYDLRLDVFSAGGDTLLSFSHPRPENPALPEPDPPFPAPERVTVNDSLVLIGDHLERFREEERARAYYDEALRRDSLDCRANTAAGIMLIKQGLYRQAATHLRRALHRDNSHYRAWYYLGLAKLGLGEKGPAEASLNRATYDLAYYAAAHLELARLALSRQRLRDALEHIERSVRANRDNSEARAMRALVLNKLGRHGEALAAARETQREDPLDLFSLSEEITALEALGRAREAAAMRDTLILVSRCDEQNHLELSIRYARCGELERAADILRRVTDCEGYRDVSPLVYYYLSRFYSLLGVNMEAGVFLQRAAEVSADYCFPSRLETVPVLRHAMEQAPQEGRPFYLLGTLYYSRGRTEEAITLLKRSVSLDSSNVVAWRNLGYALAARGEPEAACRAYESALRTGERIPPRVVLELDRLRHDLGMTPERRLRLLEPWRGLAGGSDPLLGRFISLQVQLGMYEEAIESLSTHRFHCWEGRYGIHRYWVQSHIALGDSLFADGNYEQALSHYLSALEYPDNLEVKAQPGTIDARKNYKVGLALEALGRDREAGEYYELAAAPIGHQSSAYLYFRGRALEKLGRTGQAREVFLSLLESLDHHEGEDHGGGHGDRASENTRHALRHYKRHLALEGLGRNEEAAGEFAAARRLDPEIELSAFAPPAAGW